MSKKATIKLAVRILDRFFRDAGGRTNKPIDVQFAIDDLEIPRESADPAIAYLASRGLANTFGTDIAFLTDKGIDAVGEGLDIETLPEVVDASKATHVSKIEAAPKARRPGADTGAADPELDPPKDEDVPLPPRPKAPLISVSDDEGESSYDLHEVLSIGRIEANDVWLRDPRASKRHCEIRYENGKYVLRDLGSANGTILNGRYVDTHELSHGDRMLIGRTTLVFLCPVVLVPPAASQPDAPELAEAAATGDDEEGETGDFRETELPGLSEPGASERTGPLAATGIDEDPQEESDRQEEPSEEEASIEPMASPELESSSSELSELEEPELGGSEIELPAEPGFAADFGADADAPADEIEEAFQAMPPSQVAAPPRAATAPTGSAPTAATDHSPPRANSGAPFARTTPPEDVVRLLFDDSVLEPTPTPSVSRDADISGQSEDMRITQGSVEPLHPKSRSTTGPLDEPLTVADTPLPADVRAEVERVGQKLGTPNAFPEEVTGRYEKPAMPRAVSRTKEPNETSTLSLAEFMSLLSGLKDEAETLDDESERFHLMYAIRVLERSELLPLAFEGLRKKRMD